MCVSCTFLCDLIKYDDELSLRDSVLEHMEMNKLVGNQLNWFTWKNRHKITGGAVCCK